MKLTKYQKVDRKSLKNAFKTDGGYFEVREGHTFAIIPKGNTALVSCAILNPADKYHRKYGELIALERMYEEDDCILMPMLRRN